MIRISFLLPCYKVEKYIQACLDSIYIIDIPEDEFEVLCFNDCSPDRTVEIIQKNMNHHSNLHIYHAQENIGSGGGRNALLNASRGQFVWFVDPDDMIIPYIVTSMLEQAEFNALDVLLFNYSEMAENKIMLDTGSKFVDTDVMDGLSFVDSVFGRTIPYHIGYPVRFLIRREYLLQIKLLFPERIVFQDTVWMPKLVFSANRIQASQHIGYIYWHHETSVCGTFEKSYPAKSIYTWSIILPNMLLDFVSELEGKAYGDKRYCKYATIFRHFAESYYLNKLPIILFRTSNKERVKFYQILRKEGIQSDVAVMADRLTKMCLNPVFGYIFSSIISIGYKLTHKRKR